MQLFVNRYSMHCVRIYIIHLFTFSISYFSPSPCSMPICHPHTWYPRAGDTLTHKFPKDYRLGVAFTLAQPYGFTRIMSSYYFGDDSDAGPPHLSDYR